MNQSNCSISPCAPGLCEDLQTKLSSLSRVLRWYTSPLLLHSFFFHSWTNQPISDALIIKLYSPFQYACIYTCACFCWLHIWRILIVSSRSSRSHSMERRLFLSSLVVQSISSLEAPPPSTISSLHLWWRLWAALTAFCTSLKKQNKNKKTNRWSWASEEP